MKSLLDADVMAFRAAAACKEESVSAALFTVDSIVTDALLYCDAEDRYCDKWQLYLTGSNNFRKDIAVTAPYKGNRTSPKPEHLPAVREHLISKWGAVVAEGQEADDAIAIEATKLLDKCVMISVDKDFRQIPGYHYNFVKREHFYVSAEDGIRFLYKQVLMGDSTDNIIGLHGIGPKRADALLQDCNTEQDMFDVCVKAYDNRDRVIENARLLYLRRKENELWLPPDERSVKFSKKSSTKSKAVSTSSTPPSTTSTPSPKPKRRKKLDASTTTASPDTDC
jgi:DNA polymerase-1